MKNKTLITELRKFSPELKVTIKAYLQSGCTEKGYGTGEHEGFSYSQEYTTEWNDGHLQASENDGYTVGDVIEVLINKILSEIGNDDFRLSPGELMNGYSEYDTKWEDQEPEDLPDDRDLYMSMDIGDVEYEWFGASTIEFELIDDENDENNGTSFVLEEDEIDSSDDIEEDDSNENNENDVFDIDLDAILKEMGYDSEESNENEKVDNKAAKKPSKIKGKISAKELSMNGRKKIETLQKEFTQKFPYLTLIFLDKERRAIDISKSLSEVRQAKGEDISIIASLKVNTLEKRFLTNFGLVVEIAYQKSDKVIYTKDNVNKSLNELNKWCEENDCQPFEFKKSLTGNTLYSVQEQLFEAIKEYYPNAEAKKINKDNYLDIHLPEINKKRGTHLFFNTAKDGIKIGFYCRDEEFVENVLSNSTNIEKYAQGFRILNNPLQNDVEEAIASALSFIQEITGDQKNNSDEEDERDLDEILRDLGYGDYNNDEKNADIDLEGSSDENDWDEETQILIRFDLEEDEISKAISKIKKEKVLPHLPYINEALNKKGFEMDNHICHFFISYLYIGDQRLEGFLYVNMDGFYSDCINEELKYIFTWDSIKKIDIIEQNGKGVTINLVSEQGKLTINDPYSKNLLLLVELHNSVWKQINKKFGNEEIISWNEVEKMGIKLLSFETHNEYLKWINR